jgi:hypothetical protein
VLAQSRWTSAQRYAERANRVMFCTEIHRASSTGRLAQRWLTWCTACAAACSQMERLKAENDELKLKVSVLEAQVTTKK